ncbi:MarR family winged helix-turn-helix transcriptional regulator [Burkholderia ubonensis]|uniref:MarR family winged helix-turn-helix transcriptional regulator n=1 Tax=Burkholderia ubonensis TaxID=101571 RepID=UPI000756F561|nr:MarR family transcriptional regulator [Burkholderia ubonensis]KWF03610.1 MarR family transcriptional regulator [Burkholderia ubonensis]
MSQSWRASTRPSPATEAAQIAESLREVISRFVKNVREHSGTHSNAQNETLAALERTGPVSISTLAERRSVTHQTMRLIVMKLVEQNLLTLKEDPEDRRAYLVHMTDAGQHQMAQERSARVHWLTERLLVRTNPEERALLKAATRLLDRLIE